MPPRAGLHKRAISNMVAPRNFLKVSEEPTLRFAATNSEFTERSKPTVEAPIQEPETFRQIDKAQ